MQSTAQLDVEQLKHVAVTFLGTNPAHCDDSNITQAFAFAGITKFNNDFVGLSICDIQELAAPPDTTHA